jgi:hypothetical protein
MASKRRDLFFLETRPGGLNHCEIGISIDPASIDGMGNAVSEHGGGGGLQAGIVSIEQLMPKTLAGLACGQTADMGAQLRIGKIALHGIL